MRLTIKFDKEYFANEPYCFNKDCIQKLGQLEDIEEELSINLVTLFKALKQGFYFKDDFGDIDFISGNIIKQLNKDKYEELMRDLHNYGKTWALTKEELL